MKFSNSKGGSARFKETNAYRKKLMHRAETLTLIQAEVRCRTTEAGSELVPLHCIAVLQKHMHHIIETHAS